jgi:hypothetical protein
MIHFRTSGRISPLQRRNRHSAVRTRSIKHS